ncbi:hypothetical protein PZA11_006869 [Diplocarpon coronariae]
MSQTHETPVATEALSTAPAGVNPQEHGWVHKTSYDYDKYNKSSKQLADAQASAGEGAPGVAPGLGIEEAVGGLHIGEWASNAATYTWDEDFGDIGPRHPQLEAMLFGAENHVRSGINFSSIANIDVVQEGAIRIKPIKQFKDAGLHPAMLKNVELAGYDVPTPIQQYTIPSVIEGHDVVACAQTGSGKTAAFLVPILSKLMGKAKKLCAPRPNPIRFEPGITPPVRSEPLVLIVAPSRELATQIFDEARRFCYRTMLRPCVVYGGGPLAEQIAQLARGCDVLIGTPGRLCDFINRPQILTLKRLKYMVLDEADEMLDQSWEQELKQIMSGGDQEEGNIKYLMFSATFPKIARELATQHLTHNHMLVKTLLETSQVIPDFLEQYVPEGFEPAGEGETRRYTGNVDDLQFENNSDNGEGEDADAGGGWGSEDTATEEVQAEAPPAQAASSFHPAAPPQQHGKSPNTVAAISHKFLAIH